MVVLLYVLGWAGIGIGGLMTGISMASTLMAIRWTEANIGYGAGELLIRAAPGLGLLLASLLILALGRILARLDQIALNTAIRDIEEDRAYVDPDTDY